jgi:hypothetical protein
VNSTTNTSAADQNKSWYVSDSPLHLKLRHIFPPLPHFHASIIPET